MRSFFHARIRPVRLLAAVVISVAPAACGGGSPSAPSTPTVPPTITNVLGALGSTLPSLDEMIADKTMGSASAPNTVIVYSSFTCSHCANAHTQTLPQLKSQYIDTGNARFIFRDWDRNAPDIRAAMLARCAGDAHYFDAVDMLFRTQSWWAAASDPNRALADLMRQFGMAQNVIDGCVSTAALSDAIVRSHDNGANQYGVNVTPTYVVNGQVILGDVSLAALVAKFK